MNVPVNKVSFAECYMEIHLKRGGRVTLVTLVKYLYLGLKCV